MPARESLSNVGGPKVRQKKAPHVGRRWMDARLAGCEVVWAAPLVLSVQPARLGDQHVRLVGERLDFPGGPSVPGVGQHRIVGLQAHAEIGDPVRQQAGLHGEGSELNVDTRLDRSKLEALPHLKDPFLVVKRTEVDRKPCGRQDRQRRDGISPEKAARNSGYRSTQ
jgi:hypothetical protein